MDQTMVDVMIGEEGSDSEAIFQVHRELLCFYSRYFRAAFTRNFREADDLSIRLPDARENTFRIFQHWLYAQTTRTNGSQSTSKRLKPTHNEERYVRELADKGLRAPKNSNVKANYWLDDETKDAALNVDIFRSCLDLYIFADKYDSYELRRDIMTVLLSLLDSPRCWLTEHNFFGTIKRMYDALQPSDPFCDCIATYLALMTSFGFRDTDLMMAMPKELICALLHLRSSRFDVHHWRRIEKDCCYFHNHDSKKNEERCFLRHGQDVTFLVGFLEAIVTGSEDEKSE